jgi:hypothetical protein
MAIPESQLSTWANQGSITQSAITYGMIKSALEEPTAKYDSRNFKVFLQGSYGNDTNIYAESDVDVVIRYDGAFFHDVEHLPADQQAAFHAIHSDCKYTYDYFKSHVRAALVAAFKDSVEPGGKKAIKIKANGTRRNADVVVAFEYRRYHKFNGLQDESHVTGIGFRTDTGTLIANYPKQHSENLTAKHAATNKNFKSLVRIFKNMRSKFVDDGMLQKGDAPSYYIEGLIYNVPNDKFSGNYAQIVLNALNWLNATTDRSKFVCANEQYYLLRDNCPTCWPIADGKKFIDAAIKLWNNWK